MGRGALWDAPACYGASPKFPLPSSYTISAADFQPSDARIWSGAALCGRFLSNLAVRVGYHEPELWPLRLVASPVTLRRALISWNYPCQATLPFGGAD